MPNCCQEHRRNDADGAPIAPCCAWKCDKHLSAHRSSKWIAFGAADSQLQQFPKPQQHCSGLTVVPSTVNKNRSNKSLSLQQMAQHQHMDHVSTAGYFMKQNSKKFIAMSFLRDAVQQIYGRHNYSAVVWLSAVCLKTAFCICCIQVSRAATSGAPSPVKWVVHLSNVLLGSLDSHSKWVFSETQVYRLHTSTPALIKLKAACVFYPERAQRLNQPYFLAERHSASTADHPHLPAQLQLPRALKAMQRAQTPNWREPCWGEPFCKLQLAPLVTKAYHCVPPIVNTYTHM